jgi:bifunctional UDP-N-acetylglucosamine pyrophosphorylase/glucosamine-1-phosphate N-acetyltransferase
VEHKDATKDQLAIREINTGIMCAYSTELQHYLGLVNNNNAQQEFYLTDVIKMAVADHKPIKDVIVSEIEQVQGVNDRWQLAQLERHYQLQRAKDLCLSGVTVLDPHRLDIRGNLTAAQDVHLDINIIIEGTVSIGARSKIGANVVLKNVIIGEDVEILSHCVLEDVVVANHCSVGPFARLRPGTKLAESAKVGNFVEIKNAELGQHSKVNHLSYVGDATVGNNVNIGAGTITCNYDGANKHRTTIGDNVFVGSNSALVAPVTLEENATIGAGSVITKNAPKDQLTLTRVKQSSFAGWQRPTKNKSK